MAKKLVAQTLPWLFVFSFLVNNALAPIIEVIRSREVESSTLAKVIPTIMALIAHISLLFVPHISVAYMISLEMLYQIEWKCWTFILEGAEIQRLLTVVSFILLYFVEITPMILSPSNSFLALLTTKNVNKEDDQDGAPAEFCLNTTSWIILLILIGEWTYLEFKAVTSAFGGLSRPWFNVFLAGKVCSMLSALVLISLFRSSLSPFLRNLVISYPRFSLHLIFDLGHLFPSAHNSFGFAL